MPTESDLHRELAAFRPEIITALKSVDFFAIEGPYEASELTLPAKAEARYVAASMRKNSRVWDIVKVLFVPGGLLDGGKQTAKAYGLPAPKTAKDWMDAYIKEHGGEYIGRKKVYDGVFVDTLTRADQNALTRFMWANAGKNERPLARYILRSEPQLAYLVDGSGARLRNIKRTEIGRAVNYGSWKFAADSGFTKKTWHAVGDRRTRPSHQAMSGETVKINSNFSIGYAYPQEYNCRCHLSYS